MTLKEKDTDLLRNFIISDSKIADYIVSLINKNLHLSEAPASSEYASGGSHEELLSRISELENELADEKKLRETLSAENADALSEKDRLIKELGGKAAALDKKAGELEIRLEKALEDEKRANKEKEKAEAKLAAFSRLTDAADTYNSLSSESKDALRNLFRSDSPDGFIACGAQGDSIANLWDYGRSCAVSGAADHKNIDRLFEYFVSLYNLRFENPVYELIEPHAGDKYDEDCHSCITHGVVGNISEVMLRGYKMNGKTVQKAIVK